MVFEPLLITCRRIAPLRRGDRAAAAAAAATDVEVNALIGDDAATPEAAAAEAKALVDAGYRCLKVKVARGRGTTGARVDALRLAAIRAVVGPHVGEIDTAPLASPMCILLASNEAITTHDCGPQAP